LTQVQRINEIALNQSWDGVEIVHDLPGRDRGVKACQRFETNQVVCDYPGTLLSHKDGKALYMSSEENAKGYMFAFKFKGTPMWVDATAEIPGPGRLVNHSRCHPNVSCLLQ